MAGQSGSDLLRRHIGIPLEKAPGEWVHSVAAPHELPALLARIYLIEMESDDPANALPSTDKAVSDNDDMMILVVDDHPINRRLLADQLGSLGYQCKPRMMASMRLMYLARIISISCLATSTCQIWMVTA